VERLHRRALAGEFLQNEEDRFERADGTVLCLRWQIRPWYASDRTIGGIVISTTRHTFCTRLGNVGASALDIPRLARHSSLQQSMRYTHPDMESGRSASVLLVALSPPRPESTRESEIVLLDQE
jgi:integrase